MKYTGRNLQTLQDKDLNLTLENIIRGGISSVMGDRYVMSDENKKILYMNATNLYGYSMSQPLPYDEIERWYGHPDFCKNWLEKIINTPDDSDIGYFVEVDLKYPDNIKKKQRFSHFVRKIKLFPKAKYNEYLNNLKPKNHTKSKKLIRDWTDKKKYLIHNRMLKFYVRHGMVLQKIHEIISFKQSNWLEKYINFITQKRNRAKNGFGKGFYKLPNNAFYGKTMENVRNRLGLEFL